MQRRRLPSSAASPPIRSLPPNMRASSRTAVAGVPRPAVSDDFLARIAAIAEAKGSDEAEAAQAGAVTAQPQQQDKVIEMRPRASARWFNAFDWRQMAASIVL
ncbi:MAG: hypothetical protein E5V92_34855, partial [Mesorhizobium sp.]